jgi:hypothetical protein
VVAAKCNRLDGLAQTDNVLDAVAGSEKLHNEIVAIGNEPSFRQKRLIDIGIVPVFDSPEQFAEYLNGRKLIHESGFRPR